MSRLKFIYPVKIMDGTDNLVHTYSAMAWLSREHNLRAERDYAIDMHGGRLGYTTFSFKDKDKALITKLTLGGS